MILRAVRAGAKRAAYGPTVGLAQLALDPLGASLKTDIRLSKSMNAVK